MFMFINTTLDTNYTRHFNTKLRTNRFVGMSTVPWNNSRKPAYVFLDSVNHGYSSNLFV